MPGQKNLLPGWIWQLRKNDLAIPMLPSPIHWLRREMNTLGTGHFCCSLCRIINFGIERAAAYSHAVSQSSIVKKRPEIKSVLASYTTNFKNNIHLVDIFISRQKHSEITRKRPNYNNPIAIYIRGTKLNVIPILKEWYLLFQIYFYSSLMPNLVNWGKLFSWFGKKEPMRQKRISIRQATIGGRGLSDQAFV